MKQEIIEAQSWKVAVKSWREIAMRTSSEEKKSRFVHWLDISLHDPNNHDGVITDLEPDILECEVKWALEGSIQTKLVEVMEF